MIWRVLGAYPQRATSNRSQADLRQISGKYVGRRSALTLNSVSRDDRWNVCDGQGGRNPNQYDHPAAKTPDAAYLELIRDRDRGDRSKVPQALDAD